MNQSELFDPMPLPDGLWYRPDFITPEEEAGLLGAIAALPLQEAHYKEWTAKRRIVSYGGRYDFSRNKLLEAEPVPQFLHPLRERVAQWCEISPTRFSHAMIAEYRPGTQLGWHRDVPNFDCIAGVSLSGPARMRFRPYPPQKGKGRATLALDLQPRSVYMLRGTARWDWQHAISPTKSLRYSITFRTLS
ncbi:MAG TPA: alpha-ketoglutarate-dependent dioxygenase AlkB [Woeseiaceae bacterium]|nr:alpha-ketoglutarate-dependent dioxygenase AlkB [Woeseiaceae bacterium]